MIDRVLRALAVLAVAVLGVAGSVASAGAAGDDGDAAGHGGAARGEVGVEAYLVDIVTHANDWAVLLIELEELDPLRLDFAESEQARVVALVGVFHGLPDVAAAHAAPAGWEHAQTAFEELADGYAEIALAVFDWLGTDVGSDAEAEAAAHYHDVVDATWAAYDELAAAARTALPDDGGTGPDTGYPAAAQTLVDTWSTSVDRWRQLDPLETWQDFDQADDDEFQAITATWRDAPDVTAELTAPAGYTAVHEALVALAAGYAAVNDAVAAWSGTEANSPEETASELRIAIALAAVDGLTANYEAAVAMVGGGEPTTTCGVEAAAYLECVTADAVDWSADLDSLIALDIANSQPTEADFQLAQQVLDDFDTAPARAASYDVPAGLEPLHERFTALAAGYVGVADAVFGWAGTAVGSTEEAEFEALIDELAAAVQVEHTAFLVAVDEARGELLDDAA